MLGPPLCFDHNEARKTEKRILDTAPPPLFTAAMADPGEGPGRPTPPLFFDQNEARGTKKKILGVRPPPSSQGLMTTPLPPFSEGLDPPLCNN